MTKKRLVPIRKSICTAAQNIQAENPEKTQDAQVGDGVGTAHDCEIALVPIPEGRRRRQSANPAANETNDVLTLLNGRLCNAGMGTGCYLKPSVLRA
jgi:hypothetical protein